MTAADTPPTVCRYPIAMSVSATFAPPHSRARLKAEERLGNLPGAISAFRQTSDLYRQDAKVGVVCASSIIPLRAPCRNDPNVVSY